MRENTVKTKWRNGDAVYGGWCSIPSSFSAEVMAHQGFDYVCVDMQHGLIDYQVAVTMFQAISTTGTMPFVRVPWNEFGIIGKVLDAGAMGIIVPMVNSAAEARAAVNAAKYYPMGARSFGPTRANYANGPGYFAEANREIAVIPMVETREAVQRIDEIVAVPGVDAVYVGPADLSITLGLPPGMDNSAASFERALHDIADSARRHGVIPGIHANGALAAKRIVGGFRMVTISGDVGGIAAGAAADLKLARSVEVPGARPAYG